MSMLTQKIGSRAVLDEVAHDHDASRETVENVLNSVRVGWKPAPQHMFYKLATDLRWHIHRGNIQ